MGTASREFTVVYLYAACRSVCGTSERETRTMLRRGTTTGRSPAALAAPFVAVAAAAAFLDELGPTFAAYVPERLQVLRGGQAGRTPVYALFSQCAQAWFGADLDPAVAANLRLLNTVRNDLVHPDRTPKAETTAALEARGLLLGEANWPTNVHRDVFPHDLMWDEFAIWCYDVAADAARFMVRLMNTQEVGRFMAWPFRPYRGTLLREHPVREPVARSGA